MPHFNSHTHPSQIKLSENSVALGCPPLRHRSAEELGCTVRIHFARSSKVWKVLIDVAALTDCNVWTCKAHSDTVAAMRQSRLGAVSIIRTCGRSHELLGHGQHYLSGFTPSGPEIWSKSIPDAEACLLPEAARFERK